MLQGLNIFTILKTKNSIYSPKKFSIMTKYTLEIHTVKIGMPVCFEFDTIEQRESFIVSFINSLRKPDVILLITLGERTFAH